MNKMKVLVALLLFMGVLYVAYEYTPIVKRNTINVVVHKPNGYFSRYVDIDITDKNAGIRSVSVKIISMNTVINLYDKTIGDNFVKHFRVNFKTNKVIPDGKATFVVKVVDYSKANFLSGFERVIKIPVIVDTKRPVVHLLSGIGRIRVTGSALAIFYAHDAHLKDVYVGVSHDGIMDRFKAYDASSLFHKKGVYLSFFTYRLSKNKDYSTNIYAVDKAGNMTKVHVPVYYTDFRPRRRKINITDEFIRSKVLTIMDNLGVPKKATLLDDFLYVNNVERKRDAQKILKICSNPENSFLWKGRFQQLRNSKVTATFADKRFYYYKGKLVDVKYHMGYDLASIENARVNAANSGKVVFEGYLGVYGNTMIIDHGFGVFSLYGHLSEFLVKVGDRVRKGQYVAITDTTGLAAGDHLHFDILIDGYYANPLEWWDPHWIRTHVTDVIREARTRLSLLE